jgi:hypothetical protein
MAWGFVTTIRNARVSVVRDAVDAGTGPGHLLIYDGLRPATGAAVTTQTLLANFTLADPCMVAPSGGQGFWDLNPDIITTTESFTGTKQATWCRLVDSNGNVVGDGAVNVIGHAADLVMTSIDLAGGIDIKLTTGVLTDGNP